MNPAEDIERAIREMQFRTRAAADERIMKDALAALDRKDNDQPARTSVWRIIVRNKWTKVATAAAVAITVGVLAIVAVHQSARPAYAIEQTVEANQGVRFIHIRIEPASHGSISEAWAQLADDGALLHLRMSFPDTEDGPKEVVWQADKAKVWFKAKNSVVVVREPNFLASMRDMAQIFDPRKRVEELLQARDAGKCQTETITTAEGETIKLTVPPRNNQQMVFYVDPATKLLRSFENYQIVDGQPIQTSRLNYLDYNGQQDADVFTLNPPADVILVDETTQVIGLPKGDLTDEQITVKVVREFFEALMARDYAKAGQLLSGLPAAKMERVFGKMKVLGIVSIGEPKPHWIPGVGGMVVSCRVKIEVDGKQGIQEFKPAVRPVYSQPDRWTIHGGI